MPPRPKPPTSIRESEPSSAGAHTRISARLEAAETQRLIAAARGDTRAEPRSLAATDRDRNGNQRSRRRGGLSLSTSHAPSAAIGQMTAPPGRVFNLRSSTAQPVIRRRGEGVQSRRARGCGSSALQSAKRALLSRYPALGSPEGQNKPPAELPMVGEASQTPLPLECFTETDHDSPRTSNIVEKGPLPTPNSDIVDRCTQETQPGSASEEIIRSSSPPLLSVVIAKGDTQSAKRNESGKGGKGFAKSLAKLNRFYNSAKDNVEAWVPNIQDKEYYRWKKDNPDPPPRWEPGESLANVLTLPDSSGSEDKDGPVNGSQMMGLRIGNRYEADAREPNPLEGSNSGSDAGSDDTVTCVGHDFLYADPASQARSKNLRSDDTRDDGYAAVVAFNNAMVAAQRRAVGTQHMASHYQKELIQNEKEELDSDSEEGSEESGDERTPTPSKQENENSDEDEYWEQSSMGHNDNCQRCRSRYANVWLGGCRHWICEPCIEACWWDQVEGEHHWPTFIKCPQCTKGASWVHKSGAHGTPLDYFVVNRSADAIKRLRNETLDLVNPQSMRQYIVRMRFYFGINEGDPNVS